MFRALSNLISGGADESFIDQKSAAYTATSRTMFQEQLPNIIPVKTNAIKDSMRTAVAALTTMDPITRNTNKEDVDIYTYAASTEIPEHIKRRINFCETGKLDILLANQRPSEKIRCGWLYEKGVTGTAPKINRGVLATSAGPLSFALKPGSNNGKFYWNLLEEQKAIARDRCNELTLCSNVENSEFAGKCAYDPVRGRGVPIFPDGRLMFPNDPGLTANPANLIMKRGSCPAPPPPGSHPPACPWPI